MSDHKLINCNITDFCGMNKSLSAIYVVSKGNLNIINCMFVNCAELFNVEDQSPITYSQIIHWK